MREFFSISNFEILLFKFSIYLERIVLASIENVIKYYHVSINFHKFTRKILSIVCLEMIPYGSNHSANFKAKSAKKCFQNNKRQQNYHFSPRHIPISLPMNLQTPLHQKKPFLWGYLYGTILEKYNFSQFLFNLKRFTAMEFVDLWYVWER